MGIVDDIMHSDHDIDHETQLNLNPLLDLISALIPVLLASVSYVSIAVLNAKVPVLGEAQVAIEKNVKDNKEKQVGLYVEVNGENFILMNLKQGENILTTSRVPASADSKIDKVKFVSELVRIKSENPNVFRARINPTEKVVYDNVVTIIDLMKLAPKGNEFTITDKDTGKAFVTSIMFDDVTFGNIMGEDE